MDPRTPDEAIAELLRTMSKGQYLLLCEALKQLGGELCVNLREFASAAPMPPPAVGVSFDEDVVVVRLK